MSNENDNLKPLLFDNDEVLKPLPIGNSSPNQINDEFVPISKGPNNEIKNKDSNFVFFFGV